MGDPDKSDHKEKRKSKKCEETGEAGDGLAEETSGKVSPAGSKEDISTVGDLKEEKRKKKKKHPHHQGNDDDEDHHNGEKDGEKDGGDAGEDDETAKPKKERHKENGGDKEEHGDKKKKEKRTKTLRFRKSFGKGGTTSGMTIMTPGRNLKSQSQSQRNPAQPGSARTGPTYSADDMDASPRKKHASLETPGVQRAPSSDNTLRKLSIEENKPDKLSRWASLKGIRDGFLKSPSAEDARRYRSVTGPAMLDGGYSDDGELIFSNPLLALAMKQHAQELKKEREILSESASLDERTLMRHKVINEIINTERDYIKDLTMVIKLFLEPAAKDNVLTPEEIKDIFSNIKLLVNVNSALLEDLWKQAKESNGEELGQSFMLLSHYLKMYAQYCGNQKVARVALNNALENNSRFKPFIEKQSVLPELNNLSLKDFLIKPVQRLCKYPLLLRELLKYTDETHPDYKQLQMAFEKIQDAVESVNAQKQTEEEMEEVAEMLGTLTGGEKFGVQMMVPGRKFVKEGIVKRVSKDHTTKDTAHFYMFNDLLILAEDISASMNGVDSKKKGKKGKAQQKKEIIGMLPYAECVLEDDLADDDANEVQNLVKITQKSKEHRHAFYFYFASPTEKQDWLKDLKIERKGIRDEQKKGRRKSAKVKKEES